MLRVTVNSLGNPYSESYYVNIVYFLAATDKHAVGIVT